MVAAGLLGRLAVSASRGGKLVAAGARGVGSAARTGILRGVQKSQQFVNKGRQMLASRAAAEKRRRIGLAPGTSMNRAQMQERLASGGTPLRPAKTRMTAAEKLKNMKNIDANASLANAKRVNLTKQQSAAQKELIKTRNRRAIQDQGEIQTRRAARKRVRFAPEPPKGRVAPTENRAMWTREFDDPAELAADSAGRASNFRTNMFANRRGARDEVMPSVYMQRQQAAAAGPGDNFIRRKLANNTMRATPYAKPLANAEPVRGAGRIIPYSEQRVAVQATSRNLGRSRAPIEPQPRVSSNSTNMVDEIAPPWRLQKTGGKRTAVPKARDSPPSAPVPPPLANPVLPVAAPKRPNIAVGSSEKARAGKTVVGARGSEKVAKDSKNGLLKSFMGFEVLDEIGDMVSNTQQNESLKELYKAIGEMGGGRSGGGVAPESVGGGSGANMMMFSPTNVIYNNNNNDDEEEDQPYILSNPNYSQMPWN
jgi:hypothetical protein